jgi:tetratricopeptide (TPR) repeat protein
MDSEHRHELKTNELANLLTHFPQFLKRNASTIIGLILIIIGLISWWVLPKMSREKTIAEEARVAQSIQMLGQDIGAALQAYQNQPEQLNQLLNTILANAEALLDVSSETDNPDLSALACIKAAQAIRTELHLRKDLISPETIEAKTQKAQEAYEKAAQMATLPAVQAMAQFGIGLCAEERGQTEQAADIYKEIVANENYQATVFPKQAQQRLDTLQENIESFTFVEEPQAEETPAEMDTEGTIQFEMPPLLENEIGDTVDAAAEQVPEQGTGQPVDETITPVPDTETEPGIEE